MEIFVMPPILSKPSSAAPTSLFYVTLGALMTVWSAIWFFYLSRNPPSHQFIHYICTGCLISGLVLLAIGVFIGPMGRFARKAELPPPEVTDPVVQAEQKRPTTTRPS